MADSDDKRLTGLLLAQILEWILGIRISRPASKLLYPI